MIVLLQLDKIIFVTYDFIIFDTGKAIIIDNENYTIDLRAILNSRGENITFVLFH